MHRQCFEQMLLTVPMLRDNCEAIGQMERPEWSRWTTLALVVGLVAFTVVAKNRVVLCGFVGPPLTFNIVM